MQIQQPIFRVLWRIKNGWPIPVSQYRKVEQTLVKVVHWVLIISTVLMPISGFLMSSIGGNGVAVFGFEVVARNPDPADPRRALAHNEGLTAFFHSAHYWLGYLLILAVVLHIAGALKHHFVDKDGTLKRMLGSRVSIEST